MSIVVNKPDLATHEPWPHQVTMARRINPVKLSRAREFRRHPTAAEARAWRVLRRRQVFGLKFRRQYVIEGLIVDFYCAEKCLVLEIDGGIHSTRAQMEYDRARTRVLESVGLRVVRIANADVTPARLREILTDALGRSPSPRRGEGDRG